MVIELSVLFSRKLRCSRVLGKKPPGLQTKYLYLWPRVSFRKVRPNYSSALPELSNRRGISNRSIYNNDNISAVESSSHWAWSFLWERWWWPHWDSGTAPWRRCLCKETRTPPSNRCCTRRVTCWSTRSLLWSHRRPLILARLAFSSWPCPEGSSAHSQWNRRWQTGPRLRWRKVLSGSGSI